MHVKPIRRHPNATGFQNDLYAFPGLLPDARQWFEKKFLQQTDDIASQAFTKILAGKMDALDDLQKAGWARFLMTLRFRHPDVVGEIRDRISALWKDHDRFTRQAYESERSSGDPDNFDQYLLRLSPDGSLRAELDLLVATMDNELVGKKLVSMAWAVVNLSDASYQLLTSDWPVELSLGARPPIVSLPLSPTHLFVASTDLRVIQSLDQGDPSKIAAKINRYTVGCARRYVYSSDERQKIFIRNRMSSCLVNPPFFPSLVKTFR